MRATCVGGRFESNGKFARGRVTNCSLRRMMRFVDSAIGERSVRHDSTRRPSPLPVPRPAPMPRSRTAATRFFVIVGVLGALIVYSVAALWRRDPAALFWTTLRLFFLRTRAQRAARDGGVVRAAGAAERPHRHARRARARPGRADRRAQRTRLHLRHAGKRVRAGGRRLQVIVASDGSTDGMNEALIERFDLTRRAASRGGGAAETFACSRCPNWARAACSTPRWPRRAPDRRHARRRYAAGSRRAGGAGGRVPRRRTWRRRAGSCTCATPRRGPWLVRYQYWEYVKNFMWRIGLAHLGVCLQVSGAFGAFRTRTLARTRRVQRREPRGGLRGDLPDARTDALARAATYRVEVVPDAVAYTDSPDTVPSFRSPAHALVRGLSANAVGIPPDGRRPAHGCGRAS